MKKVAIHIFVACSLFLSAPAQEGAIEQANVEHDKPRNIPEIASGVSDAFLAIRSEETTKIEVYRIKGKPANEGDVWTDAEVRKYIEGMALRSSKGDPDVWVLLADRLPSDHPSGLSFPMTFRAIQLEDRASLLQSLRWMAAQHDLASIWDEDNAESQKTKQNKPALDNP